MFYKIWKIRLPKRRTAKFSEILPRGSMIAAHHRFSYPEKTNKQELFISNLKKLVPLIANWMDTYKSIWLMYNGLN